MALPSLRAAMAGGFALSAWSSLTDPLVHEAVLRGGFDAILFDMQHGLHDVASVAAGIAAAARAGRPAIVRVPIDDRADAARALDLGAAAVVMPMIESAADAHRFVSAVKYPTKGLRSYGPARAVDVHGYASAGDYTAIADRETLALAMIETRAAMDDLAAIVAVDGLDGVFVGPSDLSIALSATGARDPESPECVAAIQAVLAAAQGAGKPAGIYAASAREARRYRDLGFPLVCVSSDVGMLRSAAVELAAAVRG
jgi:4-hydroxy-2-oxoheptanedioate aldolase